jgi:hypothetical protein
MRNILFALLLANLAMLAFRYWVVEPPRGESLQPRDVPRLVLSQPGERRSDPSFAMPSGDTAWSSETSGRSLVFVPGQLPAAASVEGVRAGQEREGPSAPRAPSRCLAAGPFSELRASDLAARQLREQGFEPVRQAEAGQVWLGYWVRAVLDGRDEASMAAEQLRQGGVPDAYVLPGEEGFTVSLGLFTQRDRAEQLRARAAVLGVAADLIDRYSAGTVYWLLLEVPAGAAVSALMPGPGARDAGIEERECGAD